MNATSLTQAPPSIVLASPTVNAAAEYARQPSEMWTGVWVIPADAPAGALSYTVTATDRFARTATFSPFINVVSQLTIVE